MKVFALIFLLNLKTAFCANILFLHSLISISHHIWNSRLAIELASKGYNVTFLSVHPQVEKNVENLHYIVFEDIYKILHEIVQFDIMEMAKDNDRNRIKGSGAAADYGTLCCQAIMKTKNGINEILNYPKNFKFDLVINDFSGGSCLLPLIQKFNYPPIVGVSPFLNPHSKTFIVGGHNYPSYVPHFIINYPQVMNFYQRFYNHLLYWAEKL